MQFNDTSQPFQTQIRTLRVQPGSLAARLDVVRAAERHAGVHVAGCAQVGCGKSASSTEHGAAFCPGHAGFAAVRGMVAS